MHFLAITVANSRLKLILTLEYLCNLRTPLCLRDKAEITKNLVHDVYRLLMAEFVEILLYHVLLVTCGLRPRRMSGFIPHFSQFTE